ncbi:tetratricopeptide repeat protein [candidate division KSB1 bacterium]|nr:tetratricopeptide repeat protein [candidate division KSB1 bacterium]
MNGNMNFKKRAGTSIAAIIVVVLGLFLVCGVRPPQPLIDDFASENESFNDDSSSMASNDDELAGILDENTPAGANDDLASESTSSKSGSDDGDMNEILKLLDSDDNSSDSDDDLFAFDEGASDRNEASPVDLASVDDVTSSSGSSEEKDRFEGAMSNEVYTQMETEADRLNQIYNKKAVEADSLKKVLDTLDEKKAVLELEKSSGNQYAPAFAKTNRNEQASSAMSYQPPDRSSSAPAASTRSPRTNSSAKSVAASGSFDTKYNRALEQFNTGKYDHAMRFFEELISNEPSNSLADNCQFWMGECFLALKDYTRAVLEYEKVFSFDDREKSDEAQFKIGMSFLESGNRKMARYEFGSLLDFYADSELARKARTYLQRL